MGIDIKVSVEELRKRKLFLAVPMYGGQCSGMFARSVADLSALCTLRIYTWLWFLLFWPYPSHWGFC